MDFIWKDFAILSNKVVKKSILFISESKMEDYKIGGTGSLVVSAGISPSVVQHTQVGAGHALATWSW